MLIFLALQPFAPPDTTSYMIAGYGVIFLCLGLYLASLVLRSRKLRQELDVLQPSDQV